MTLTLAGRIYARAPVDAALRAGNYMQIDANGVFIVAKGRVVGCTAGPLEGYSEVTLARARELIPEHIPYQGSEEANKPLKPKQQTKTTTESVPISESEPKVIEPEPASPPTKRRGRPPGSKNKPK